MVLAYFVTIGHYGFWLPNDDRGSGSFYVGSKRLLPYGEATGIPDRRRSRASLPHDRETSHLAKQALKYPPVHFTGEQAWSVAQGFAAAAHATGCVICACSIMPDHTHLVILRHHYEIEKVVDRLKARASGRLKSDGRHPFQNHAAADGRLPSVWGGESWNVFLDHPDQIREKIGYTEDNPEKRGLLRQRWHFVTRYDG